MGYKVGFLLISLLAGCLADPLPNVDFFDHTNPGARIVGGTPAAEGSVPHMVAMTNGILVRSFVCGGSILTPRTVMTAAHCIEAVFSWGALSSSLRVTVGTNRWNSGGQTYSVARNVTHENYVSSLIKNDLGLLITASDMVFSAVVRPVLPSFDFVDAGVAVRAAGWGRIRQGGALSATLLELEMRSVEGQRCAREVAEAAALHNFLNVPPVEPHIELCTEHSVDHGMCNGDSGSALVRVDRGQQVGVVSWGLPCARGAPDMFVRVSAYGNWILGNMV